MNDFDERVEREIFAKTLNKLIERTGKTYRQIADEIGIAESSFFDLRNGSRSYKYQRLDNIVQYFRTELKDDKITLRYLLLGSDEVRDNMSSIIEEMKKKYEKELYDAAFREAELRQQIDMFPKSED